MTSELFIDLLPPKRCPASAALAPQNFGVIDLRHQFAIHNPVGGGPLDDCMELFVQDVTQDVTKIKVFPFFQQVAVGGDLSLQLDLDVRQGLTLLGLGQLSLQVQQDPIELFVCIACLYLPQAVLQAGLQISH